MPTDNANVDKFAAKIADTQQTIDALAQNRVQQFNPAGARYFSTQIGTFVSDAPAALSNRQRRL